MLPCMLLASRQTEEGGGGGGGNDRRNIWRQVTTRFMPNLHQTLGHFL